MPTAETLRALIALVEEAKAGSEELDARIWQATQPDRKVMLDAGVAFGPGEKRDATFGKLREFPMDGWADYKAVAASIEAPPLTTSIDAALALVAKVLPKDWPDLLRDGERTLLKRHAWHICFAKPEQVSELPLAILVALLRALLQQSETSHVER